MDSTLKEHFNRYDEDAQKYMEDVQKIFADPILNKSAGLTTKSHIICTLLNKLDRLRFEQLHQLLDLPEIVRACEILDSHRLVNQLSAKLLTLPETGKKRKDITRRLIIAKSLLTETETKTESGSGSTDMGLSFSLSKIKIVKQWVKSIPKDKLEYRAMLFDTSLWTKLADLTHLNPKRDFVEGCEWFLPYCFGDESVLPEGSIVHAYNKLSYDNFHVLYDHHRFPYEVIRSKIQLLPPSTTTTTINSRSKHGRSKHRQSKHSKYQHQQTKQNPSDIYKKNKHLIRDIKIKIVNYENINTIVWYWDELVDTYNEIDVLFRIRIEHDGIDMSYGKIVDLISKTKNQEILQELLILGDDRLKQYKINESFEPVAVFGDQSSSMEIAIKTSGIITSLLCYICNAALHMFHSESDHIMNPPRSIVDAVKFGKEVKTKGYTCPAASMLYYYTRKEVVKTIIIITDEGENRSVNLSQPQSRSQSLYQYMVPSNNTNKTKDEVCRFAELYQKYITEVYPARLIFVSFSDPNKDAEMVSELKLKIGSNVVDELVKVFKFNVKDPDLQRMDIVLKYLANE